MATAAARAGREALMWAYEPEVVQAINETHENSVFLPGVPLDPAIRATGDMADLGTCEFILMVCPAQFMRPISRQLATHLGKDIPLVICAKGIEKGSGALMSDVLGETAPDNPLAVLSGPTFAAEVARGLPAAVTIAAATEDIARHIAEALGHAAFRPYWTDDIIGAQIGGALKNVLAIACGIAVGKKLGENTKAMLITRGMAELTRFGEFKGARAETLMGLSGLGDLILTCSSEQSRNMSLGVALGQGKTMEEVMAGRRSVAEGVHSSVIGHQIAKDNDINMPILSAVYAVLHKGLAVDAAIEGLMDRPFTREMH
jgi:glycerol-3-phosphate dehydrogenase (NAD(P)+)